MGASFISFSTSARSPSSNPSVVYSFNDFVFCDYGSISHLPSFSGSCEPRSVCATVKAIHESYHNRIFGVSDRNLVGKHPTNHFSRLRLQLAVGTNACHHDLLDGRQVLALHILVRLGDVLLQERHDARHSQKLIVLNFIQITVWRDEAQLGVDVVLQTRGALRLQNAEIGLDFLDCPHLSCAYMQ